MSTAWPAISRQVKGRDAVRARPPAHRQRDVAAPRTDVEDAQGGTGMAPRSFGGQKTPDCPDAAEITIDRLHEPVAGGGQRRITVWPVQKLRCRCARVKHPRAFPLPW